MRTALTEVSCLTPAVSLLKKLVARDYYGLAVVSV